MSTTPTTPPAPATQTPRANEVRIFSHSTLFYWWPVWAIAFILGILTWIEGNYLVVVPKDAEAKRNWQVTTAPGKTEIREGVLLKTTDDPAKQKHLAPNRDSSDIEKDPELRLHISSKRSYGVLFLIVLLLVIVITNVPLRGMWSVMIIMLIILFSIIFALAGWWDAILRALRILDIRITQGGYFFLGIALCAIWAVSVFVFDRQLYIIYQPGALRVCLQVGGGEKQYDTVGMTIEKERSDLFRHWILGLGSGDMIVRTAGADHHEFRLNNVLFIGRKLQQVEEMQRNRQVRAV